MLSAMNPEDRKMFMRAAILSFAINVGIWIISIWAARASNFPFVVAVPIVTLLLVFSCAVLGKYPIAIGLMVGLTCGLPVGLITAIIYGIAHIQLEVLAQFYLHA